MRIVSKTKNRKIWSKGDIYIYINCTCRTCLRPSDKIRKLNRHDVLSIPNRVIKKGPSLGARHGNTERQRIYHAAHVSSQKAKKKGFISILDRFLKCHIYRQSQLDIGETVDHCARLDETAAEDHSYIATAAERARRENTWILVLNSSVPNGPMNQREDYQDAIRIKECSYQEPGHANPRLHPREQFRQRPDQPFAWHDEGPERVDPKTGWRWYDTKPSPSSSSSEWQPSSWWQSSSCSQTSRWCDFLSQDGSLTGNGDSL